MEIEIQERKAKVTESWYLQQSASKVQLPKSPKYKTMTPADDEAPARDNVDVTWNQTKTHTKWFWWFLVYLVSEWEKKRQRCFTQSPTTNRLTKTGLRSVFFLNKAKVSSIARPELHMTCKPIAAIR